MAMVAHRRATGEEIMVGSGCGCRYRVGSRSTKERKRERRGANAWRNSWNLPSASYGCSLYNGAANTTAIPRGGGSEGELKKFDVEGRGKREEVPVVSFVRGSRKYRRFRAAGSNSSPRCSHHEKGKNSSREGIDAGGVKPVASRRAWAWARAGVGRVQGEGGREKSQEMGETSSQQGAGRLGEKTSWKDRPAGVSGKWSSWCRKETRCMLHNPCRTSLPFPSHVPSPQSQLAGFPASPPALAELAVWLGFAGAKGCRRLGSLGLVSGGCRKRYREKDVARHRRERGNGTCEIDSRTVEWSAQPPGNARRNGGSKTDKRNAAHVVTEGTWGISQSHRPGRAGRAYPCSAAERRPDQHRP